MKVKGRKWLWTLFTALALTSLALPVLAEKEQSSTDKVAVVNKSIITRADYDRELRMAQSRFSRMGKPTPDSQLSAIKQEALERLIERELLYQESQKQGIKVDEAALDEEFKQRFPDEAKLKNVMNSMNLTEADLKSEFRKGIRMGRLIEKEVIQKVTVSASEARDYYDKKPELFKEPEKVRASHILIKVDSKASKTQKDEARKKLEKIKTELKKDEDFAAFAKELSQCPTSTKGGNLGYFRRGQMVKPFEEAAFALKPGEVSDIVETRFGYHLIKLTDKKPERTIPYREAKDRITQRLKNQKIQAGVTLYIKKLKEKAKVERFLPKDAN